MADPADSPPAAASTTTLQGPEIDTDEHYQEDHDSAIGSFLTSTTSITESLYHFHYENGRRYHAQRNGAQYNLPNDENELDRLDLQHHLFLLTLGGQLYRAPLGQNIQHAIDLGTGTGIWAMDFADQFQQASVIGNDLSPVQPTYVPPNCTFFIENIEEPWTCEPGTYDFVHGRMIVAGIKNWENLVRQAFHALKPGGWIEFQDCCFPVRTDDSSATADSPVMVWSQYMIQSAANLGIDITVANKFPQILRDVGFTDVRMEWFTWPLGRWAKQAHDKERGMWSFENFDNGIQGFSMGFFSRGLGWRKEEVDALVLQVKQQLRSRSTHCYLPIWVICARKPEVEA